MVYGLYDRMISTDSIFIGFTGRSPGLLVGVLPIRSITSMMKPHSSIFNAVLNLMAVSPGDAMMVGDSVRHDVEGALHAGMRAALLHRSGTPHPLETELAARGVPTIRSLRELPGLLH